MSRLIHARLIVAGAGAMGACIALGLARAGAQVALIDPGPRIAGASGVAAGMLAPAFECVLDPLAGLSFDLMRAARDLWTPLAASLGEIGLTRDGGLWLDVPGAPPRREAIAAELARIGARVAPTPTRGVDPAQAEAGVFTPDDWRLDPVATLKALDRALREAGVRMVAARLQAFEAPRAVLSDGETLPADGLIVATGAQAAHLAPELASLVPIKGQILGYPTLPVPEGAPALRCADGYAVGGPDGLQVGATMQAGARDLAVDPAVTDRLHALAVRLYPQAADLVPVARVGVRAAATDGPPMIGPSARDGVWIAAGARRNGWLLGPLAAQIIVAGVQGRDLGAFAGVLKPRSPA